MTVGGYRFRPHRMGGNEGSGFRGACVEGSILAPRRRGLFEWAKSLYWPGKVGLPVMVARCASCRPQRRGLHGLYLGLC